MNIKHINAYFQVFGSKTISPMDSVQVLKSLRSPHSAVKKFFVSLSIFALLIPSMPVFAAATVTTTTTLTSSVKPSQVGQSTTLTALVTGTTLTGTVTFKSGTTTLGTGTLSGTGNTRTATYVATFTSVATNSLTAVYGGDATNKTSTSSAVSQFVNKKTATTSVASSLNPSTSGASVTFTATVVGYNPTGTITFKDGTTTLGTGTLAGTGNTRTATYVKANLSAATHSITAVYAGDTLNTTATSSAISQVVNKKTATASVASNLNPSTSGASVTFTATVVGYNPTGTITFKDGTTTLGTGTLAGTGNTRTATYVKANLSAATHSITAVYAGDTLNTTATSSAISQVVTAVQSTTTTTVTSDYYPAPFGNSVTFTATVSGNAPTGTVTFKDGAANMGTGTLAGGVATVTSSVLSVGSHIITAVYGGDVNNAPSTSSGVTEIIDPVETGVSLASSANSTMFGSSVTFTATVFGNAPTGTVTFKDGTATMGTGTVTSGVATFTTNSMSVGSHNIRAVYEGDVNNAASGLNGNTVNQTVLALAATTTGLASSVSPSMAGGSVTFTATVVGNAPTGTVTFKDGAATLGTGTVTGGVATVTSSVLSVGSHIITAVYGGDVNNAASTSSGLSQTVLTLATTSTGLASSANPSVARSSVTFTATVSGNAPTGTVTFKDGAATMDTGTLAGGIATVTSSSLSVGSHNITAVYGGDANNASSTSGALSQVVTVAVLTSMTWQFGYDAMGRLTTTVDPLANTTYTYYDSLGRPIQTQQPANTGTATPTVTNFAYNAADSLTKVIDPRNVGTTYSPNGLGQVVSQTSADSGATSYTYDAAGNVLTSTDARGKVTTMAYDALDRLIGVTYPTARPIVLEYDGGANPVGAVKGQLTKVTDGSGFQSFGFDAAGMMTGRTQVTNGKTFVLGYTWGDAGSALDKLVSITYPSGNKVNYTYDLQGGVSGVSVSKVNPNGVGVSGTANSLLTGVTLNAFGAVTSWNWSSGVAHTVEFDKFGQVSGYSLGNQAGVGASAGERRVVTHDLAGRITAYAHTNNGAALPGLDQSFAYDNLDRMTLTNLGGVSTQYNFDATGNRTSKVVNGTTYTNAISPTSNRQVTVKDVGGTFNISYDTAGHVINDGVNTYTYGDNGRMATVTTPGGVVSYSYNASGLRVLKTGTQVPTGAAYYVYTDAGQLLGEYDANGAAIYETVYLGNVPVGILKSTGTAGANNLAVAVYNVHTDHLAAPRIVTRQSDEAIVWRWDSAESYGGSAPDTNPNGLGTFAFNQRFPGQVFDAETGLFQNWNREYNARLGRYMQSDPIGLAGGINTYGYVEGNPLSGIDPMGLDTAVVFGGTTGGNPFGHVAIGFTGQGIYSYGTGTLPGSSLTAYLASQAAYRDSFVYILKTTPEQEAKMREQILKYRSTPLPKPQEDPFGAARDTCATRTQSALEAGGITSILNPYISPFPRDTLRLARSNAESMTLIPKGRTIPGSLSAFNR